jgi:hypothetical protein
MSDLGTCPAFGYECEYVSMVEAQAAEIERLRGKLQYMADTNLADDDYRIIAREALAGKAEQ